MAGVSPSGSWMKSSTTYPGGTGSIAGLTPRIAHSSGDVAGAGVSNTGPLARGFLLFLATGTGLESLATSPLRLMGSLVPGVREAIWGLVNTNPVTLQSSWTSMWCVSVSIFSMYPAP